jgi:crotonobetainyl-CoA:carnitine CoA-transferase CaiB-like acyl-CoA transferase
MENALSDITVLDLTHHVAGPYCTKMLGDYGAEIIKIEKPGVGDGARRMGPFWGDDPHPEKSGLFLHLNTNKKSITLNLKNKTGIKIFKELVKDVDILVENFEPRVMADLRIDYKVLEKINPGLVKTSISNFGQTGPYRDYKASELTIFGMGPHMISEGEPDREPLQFPGYKSQYLAGNYAAAVTMGALFGSKTGGIGQEVDVSIMECLSSPPEGAARLMLYEFSNDDIERDGHRKEGYYPYGYYPCKDGVVLIYGFLPSFWPRIAKWMEMPELLEDIRFIDPVARPGHHGDFEAILYEWLLERTQQDLIRSAQAQKIPVSPVYQMDEVLKDPQFTERGAFVDIDHPVTGKITYPGVPFTLPKVESKPQKPAPLLGQHNHEIYGSRLGYQNSDLVRLREEGII